MRYAVWGRTSRGPQEHLLATFWTNAEAGAYRNHAVLGRTPVDHGICALAVVEKYDGQSQIDDARPFKKSRHPPSSRYGRMVTVMGPNGVKHLERQPAAR